MLSYLIAVSVALAWLALMVGLLLFWRWVWPAPVGVVLGLILTFIAVYLRPKLPKLATDVVVASADEFPVLHAEVAALAVQMGSRPPDVLGFAPEFNAYTTRIGLRRRRVIVVGMVLWEFLDDGERRAIVAHELAHEINGDLRRGLVVGTSQHLLGGWIETLHPGSWSSVSGATITDMATWMILRVSVLPLEVVWRTQRSLILEQSRLAEFQADKAASCAVGHDLIAALDKLRLQTTVEFALERAVRQGDRPLLSAGRRRLEGLSDDQIAAIRGAEWHTHHSVDSTHPPTTIRIERLVSLGLGGAIETDELRAWQRVDAELEPIRTRIEERLAASVSAHISG